jgi:Fic family protein
MASNRMTREQVEALYKTDKIRFLNEPLKVNDLIEVRNQFRCLDYVLDQAMTPLTQTMIRKLHSLTLADGWGHKRKTNNPGAYRKYIAPLSFKSAAPAEKINSEMGSLIKIYESKERIDFRDILDFHVRLEHIRPFDNCNGRVGRMIMFKECLRHGITPFILDDKRRHKYLEGIRHWDENPDILTEVCLAAQDRFSAQIDLQELLRRHGDFMRLHS